MLGSFIHSLGVLAYVGEFHSLITFLLYSTTYMIKPSLPQLPVCYKQKPLLIDFFYRTFFPTVSQ